MTAWHKFGGVHIRAKIEVFPWILLIFYCNNLVQKAEPWLYKFKKLCVAEYAGFWSAVTSSKILKTWQNYVSSSILEKLSTVSRQAFYFHRNSIRQKRFTRIFPRFSAAPFRGKLDICFENIHPNLNQLWFLIFTWRRYFHLLSLILVKLLLSNI